MQIAEEAGIDQLFHAPPGWIEAEFVVDDGELSWTSLGSLIHLAGLGDRHGHGFFANDVLTGLEGSERDLAMVNRRGRDDDERDFGEGEQLLVVVAGVGDGELLRHFLSILKVATADRHEFSPLADTKGRSLRAAGKARPDQPDSNLLFFHPFVLCSRRYLRHLENPGVV